MSAWARGVLSGVLLAGTLLGACGGDDDGGIPDGALPDCADLDGSTASTIAAPPGPPTLTPCPDGWREVVAAGFTTCDPWPEGGRGECADHEVHLPGRPGCEPVGTACSDDFAPDLPADRMIIYVLAGSTAGDGTRAAPHDTVTRGTSAARSGDVTAVGRGTYDAALAMGGTEELWGACPEATIIQATVGSTLPVISVGSGSTTIRNLTIGPSPRPGIVGGFPGTAVHLDRVVIRGVTGVGVGAQDSARVELVGTVIRDVAPPGGQGTGLQVVTGGAARLERTVVERAPDRGITVFGDGATVDLTASVVAGTVARPGGVEAGLFVFMGGEATASQVVMDANDQLGVHVEASTLHVEDSTIRGTVARIPASGAAINSVRSAVDLSRTWVHDNAYGAITGVFAPTLSLRDVVISNTRVQATSSGLELGVGVLVGNGNVLEVERLAVGGSFRAGVVVSAGAATITDLTVTDTRAVGAHAAAGIQVQDSEGVSVTRALVGTTEGVGILGASEGAPITLSDIVVENTRHAGDSEYARAVQLENGVQVVGSRLHVRTAEVGGVSVYASSLDLSGASIEDVVPASCPGCADGAAVGLFAAPGSQVTVRDFDITRVSLCGVHVVGTAELTLTDGEVSESAIGACVQSDGYDLDRLTNDVYYRDNGVNLESTDLPIPEPVPAGVGL